MLSGAVASLSTALAAYMSSYASHRRASPAGCRGAGSAHPLSQWPTRPLRPACTASHSPARPLCNNCLGVSWLQPSGISTLITCVCVCARSFSRACSPVPTPLLFLSFSRRCTRRCKGCWASPCSLRLHLAEVPAHEGGDEEDAHLLYMGAPWPMAPRRMSAQAHSVSAGQLRAIHSRV